MGDSRGRWEGDTLVVDVGNNNDKTWFDMAGDFHSDALHVVERYRMTGHDTIQYEATIEDSKVFTKPWTISIPLQRRTDRDRLFEYVCQAEAEEANGAFTREERTWYPGNGTLRLRRCRGSAVRPRLRLKPVANLRRTPDGKPDLQGFYDPDGGGANYGLEKTRRRRTSRRVDAACSSIRRTGFFPCSRGPWRKEPSRNLHRTRLRRSDGALFPGRCSAIDVCPDVVSHHSNIRITSSFCTSAWHGALCR